MGGDVDSDARPDRHHHTRGMRQARGGLYEILVVDPAWPKRPGIIQPYS